MPRTLDMTSERIALLRQAGEALYGERWQSALAQALGIRDSSRVREWLSSRRRMPEGVLEEILSLLAQRQKEIQKARESIHEVISSAKAASAPAANG